MAKQQWQRCYRCAQKAKAGEVIWVQYFSEKYKLTIERPLCCTCYAAFKDFMEGKA